MHNLIERLYFNNKIELNKNCFVVIVVVIFIYLVENRSICHIQAILRGHWALIAKVFHKFCLVGSTLYLHRTLPSPQSSGISSFN
jgi:hypothetical protein